MEARLVEFIRTGNLERGSLREGDEYLVSCGSEPVYAFEMTLNHVDYLDMVKALSYKMKKPEREAALTSIAGVVTGMLKSDALALDAATGLLQFDLVVNAAELGALQFEAALAADGQPLLARDDCPVELTRRVRGAFLEKRLKWPATPRVLFAWASPPGAGAEVPHAEHVAILRDALTPWIGPRPGDEGKVLTVLDEVTLARLTQTLRQAQVDAKPYTHVHFLAHGYPIGSGHRQTFGMALHDDNLELAVVAPDQLVDALASLRDTAATVTLATCDSGNESNTLVAEKSIAHQLHVSGIPIVLASQYPLTMAGSNLLVASFYRALLMGEDVRVALHKARIVLRGNQAQAYHDWISLVCYASLPEGYAEVLLGMRLERTLAALKTAQDWSDALVSGQIDGPDPFPGIEARLLAAISGLIAHLAATGASQRRNVLEENYGLLGSAEKRLSELYFLRAGQDPAGGWVEPMRAAMTRAQDWYLKAARRNLSQHWQAVQALSLEVALSGRIARPGLWHAAVESALIAKEDANEYWALGSLIELYLLAPFAVQRSMAEEAAAARAEMRQRLGRLAEGHRDRVYAPNTTRRQIQRYVQWWTRGNGFFPDCDDLCAQARLLHDEGWVDAPAG